MIPDSVVEAALNAERIASGYTNPIESFREGWPRSYAEDMAAMRSALEAAAPLLAPQRQPGLPRIVCLCGSTRFYEEWQEWNYRETMAGNIVLTVGFYPHCADKAHAAHVGVGPGEKEKLDELHKRKIDLADEVLVLNVGGYIGDSTRSEIRYAVAHFKPVRYLEPLPQPPKETT